MVGFCSMGNLALGGCFQIMYQTLNGGQFPQSSPDNARIEHLMAIYYNRLQADTWRIVFPAHCTRIRACTTQQPCNQHAADCSVAVKAAADIAPYLYLSSSEQYACSAVASGASDSTLASCLISLFSLCVTSSCTSNELLSGIAGFSCFCPGWNCSMWESHS